MLPYSNNNYNLSLSSPLYDHSMSAYFTPAKSQMIYKLDKAPPIVQKVLYELGWIEFDEKIHEPNQWNIWWKSAR
jgi:hypothetical protein